MDCTKQANDFLKITKTSFSYRYLTTDKYFPSDNDVRDIYEITLKRGDREYKFKYGQSINASGKYIFKAHSGDKNWYYGKRFNETPNNMRSILKRLFGYIDYNGSIDKNKDFREPNAYDVLCSCNADYFEGSFEYFCESYGYNNDSIKANKVYLAVIEATKQLKMLYNDKEIEMLKEIF